MVLLCQMRLQSQFNTEVDVQGIRKISLQLTDFFFILRKINGE